MIETRAIGHMSEPIEIHLLEMKQYKKKKNVFDIYFREKEVANNYLWNKWRKILNIKINDDHSRKIFESIFRYAIKKNDKSMLIPFRHNSDILGKINRAEEWQQHDVNNVLNNYEPNVKFENKEIEQGYKILEKMNISKNDKIILLAVRDPSYRKHSNEITNRDNDINEFKPLVEYLCNKNYKVLRMGKKMKERLDFNHNNFTDYAFHNLNSDFMDIFLFYASNFVISTGSGLDAVASLFRKKKLYLNSGELNSFNFRLNSNISFIYPKKVFDSKKNIQLSLFDIFEKGLDKLTTYEDYKKRNILFKTLSPVQMINATQEMENFIENGYSEDSKRNNKLINEYLFKKYKIKINFHWSNEYLSQQIERINN